MEPDELLQLSDLNLAESQREISRWSSNTEITERGDMLLVTGADRFVSCNLAMRVGRRRISSPEEFIARAREYFNERKRTFRIMIRAHLDDDLLDRCRELELYQVSRSPAMVLYRTLKESPLPEGVVLRRVTDEASARDYAEVMALSFASLGQPEEVGRSMFGDAGALLAPHMYVVVAYKGEEPVSGAMALLSHGIAGLYFVGTVEDMRGQGLAEHCTRAAGNAALGLGARCLVLQASHMGEPVYSHMGYEEFTSYPWFICPSR